MESESEPQEVRPEHKEKRLIAFAVKQSEHYKDLAWCHQKSARKYHVLSKALSIPTAIIAAVTGGTSLVALGGKNGGYEIELAIHVLAIIQAILFALVGVLDLGKRETEHVVSCDAYNRLAHQLQTDVIQPAAQRLPVDDILQSAWKTADDIQQKAALIPDSIYADFKKAFDKVCSAPELSLEEKQ
jgi:hypothetical protein